MRGSLPPRRFLPRLAVGLAALSLAAAVPPKETFHEAVDVREAEVIIGLPPALEIERDRSLRPADFTILVDGSPRPALRIEPLSRTEAPWRIVVALDPELCHPDALFASALALASASREIAAAGKVDIATFDPATAWAGRDLKTAESIEFALAEQAGAVRADERRNEPRTPRSGRAAARRLDEIARFLLDEPGGGPRLLILPIDPILPGEEAAIEPAVRLLAAYGWTVVPMSLRDLASFDLDGPGVGDVQHWNETSLVKKPGINVNAILRWLRGKRAVPPPHAQATIEAEMLPELAGPRRLAAASAGVTIDREAQIRPALAAFAERYRLTFEPPVSTAGKLLPFLIKTPRGGPPAISTRFLHAGASGDLAELLLRGLLAGDAGRRELGVRCTRAKTKSGETLAIELPAPRAGDDPLGPVRISWAYEPPSGGPRVHHEIVESPAPGAASLHRKIDLPADASGRPVAVLVQLLRGEAAWSGRVSGG